MKQESAGVTQSIKDSLQLDEVVSVGKPLGGNNESFGLDLSNLNNITSVHDQSLHEINTRLEHGQENEDEQENNYSSIVSNRSKFDQKSNGGVIKDTRAELQN